MSLLSFVSDLCNSLTVSVVQAEAAPAEQRVESQPKENAKEEEPEAEQEPEKKEEGKEEEEEEEADEPQDPAPAIIEGLFFFVCVLPGIAGQFEIEIRKRMKRIEFADLKLRVHQQKGMQAVQTPLR